MTSLSVLHESSVNTTHSRSHQGAWFDEVCPHCGLRQLIVVARQKRGNETPDEDAIKWLKCPSCLQGAVWISGAMHPGTQPLRKPKGLPATDAQIWAEARNCLGIGANVAAVMLCRKLLFHMAVENGLPEKNAKGFAPNFYEAIQQLESVGKITADMKPWVKKIKDVGNDANHEITPVTADDAKTVATFTLQLLVLVYEMKALMAEADPVAADVIEAEDA